MSTDNKPKKKGELSPKAEAFIEHHGIILFIWFLSVVLSWFKVGAALRAGELQGNDDYMRLAQIRDWLGGQGWFDLNQYRLNPQTPSPCTGHGLAIF